MSQIRSDPESLTEAVRILEQGGLVSFPTETVYGLGADAGNADAVELLYRTKGRPADHPCIVHLAEDSWLDEYARRVPPHARTLAQNFWPGPLTIVVERADNVAPAVTGGLDTVGLRVPDHELARALITAFSKPLVAPSANRFGRLSPTTAQHVAEELGNAVALILDGGPCRVGVESTIVDCTVDPPVILRPGGLTAEALSGVLGLEVGVKDKPGAAPGTLPAHYAPQATVVLATRDELADAAANAGGTVAVFARNPPEIAGARVIAAPRDLGEYAHELYAVLRALDADGVDTVVIEPVEESGLGVAINDRLRRASKQS